jgi:methionyl aminopeptidase
MSVTIKTADEIEKMRIAGRLAAQVLEMLEEHVQPGTTTDELNRICHDFIVNEQRAIPAPLNYKGFPRSICTSVNNQVCHGIPGNKRLKKGDIVNVDITVIKDGFHGDTSKMFFVGDPSVLAQRLVRATQEAMRAGIAEVRPGATLREIARAVETHATKEKFTVVREYCGHGIGRAFHEEPQVLHYVDREHPEKQDLVLAPGMCFTIEPMINAGKRQVKLLPDGWTVVTKDRSLSAQWEHTILVTNDGHEVLTLRDEEGASSTNA